VQVQKASDCGRCPLPNGSASLSKRTVSLVDRSHFDSKTQVRSSSTTRRFVPNNMPVLCVSHSSIGGAHLVRSLADVIELGPFLSVSLHCNLPQGSRGL